MMIDLSLLIDVLALGVNFAAFWLALLVYRQQRVDSGNENNSNELASEPGKSLAMESDILKRKKRKQKRQKAKRAKRKHRMQRCKHR